MNNSSTKTYWKEFHDSFVQVRGTPFALFALFLGLFYFCYSNKNVEAAWKSVIVISVLVVILLITLFTLSFRLHQKALKQLPSVLLVKEPLKSHPNSLCLLLLESSALFGHETLVSIYFKDDEFEVFLGLGYVFNIQDDGRIQILVTYLNEGYDATWDNIKQNNSNTLKKMNVKPSIPRMAQGI